MSNHNFALVFIFIQIHLWTSTQETEDCSRPSHGQERQELLLFWRVFPFVHRFYSLVDVPSDLLTATAFVCELCGHPGIHRGHAVLPLFAKWLIIIFKMCNCFSNLYVVLSACNTYIARIIFSSFSTSSFPFFDEVSAGITANRQVYIYQAYILPQSPTYTQEYKPIVESLSLTVSMVCWSSG